MLHGLIMDGHNPYILHLCYYYISSLIFFTSGLYFYFWTRFDKNGHD
jgi:hypothetical protein